MKVALLLVIFCVVAACIADAGVSSSSVIRRLPIKADGAWHDFERLALEERGSDVVKMFSRRFVIKTLRPRRDAVVYKEDDEDYFEQLSELDKLIQSFGSEPRTIGEHVCQKIVEMRKQGVFVTQRPKESYRFYTEDDFPAGPNTANLSLEYWPKGPGRGECELIRVRFVQEFEQWRIDGVTPDIFFGE